jgi:hypothetical protein
MVICGRRLHVLAPLMSLTGKGAFVWTDKHAKALHETKALIAADALLAYPYHNLPFAIYRDASDYQLGAAIMQNGYYRKLTAAQRNYTLLQWTKSC